MKKFNRKNRAVVSGILVGLASIYAVAGYFDLEWAELGSLMLGTILFFAAIVLLAALAVLSMKLVSRLIHGPAENHKNQQRDKE